VTLEYDQAFLESYRPRLDTTALHVQPSALFGWRASSPDRDQDVAIYCAGYAVQDDILRLTSHDGDHEWIYVFVDQDGTIDHVVYTAYHWLKGALTEPVVYEDADGPHPVFQVAKTYHNYIPASSTGTGRFVELKSLGHFSSESGPFFWWLDAGMESDLRHGAVVNPWTMQYPGGHPDWWDRDGLTWMNVALTSAWKTAGLRGWEQADGGDREL